MTARKCVGYGLIAGLTFEEIKASAPGFILDMYLMRMRYDDEQHGIKRKKAAEWGDD